MLEGRRRGVRRGHKESDGIWIEGEGG